MNRREFLGGTTGLGVALAFPLGRSRRVEATQLPSSIVDFSASQLSAAIRQGEVSCFEVMQSYLQHIHRYNPAYNAIVSMVDDDVLIVQAERADQALARGEYWGWMHGMPHAVKDLADVQGFPTSQGSPIYAGTVAEEDSFMIGRIRGRGRSSSGKPTRLNLGWDPKRTMPYSVPRAAHGIQR